MTAKEIIVIYLKEHGYDGLCCSDCGCGIDDLMPCHNFCEDCEPAYRWECAAEKPNPYDADCDVGNMDSGAKCKCFRPQKQEAQ